MTCDDSTDCVSYGLIFFGTPHGGTGDGWRVVFGKATVKIAQSIPGRTENDIMEALRNGSVFSHELQSQWRHQLDHYQIVTFYEGIGDVRDFINSCHLVNQAKFCQVVPQSSATIGLTGTRESQLKIQAKHGDMCRFNPDVPMDRKNYELVEGNLLEMCEQASQLGKRDHTWVEATSDVSLAPWILAHGFVTPLTVQGPHLSMQLASRDWENDDPAGPRQVHREFGNRLE